MRGLLLSAVMLFGVAAPAAARRGAAIPHHAKPGPILVVEATGEVKSMTLKQITVGRVTCALGPNAARAARFVITDPVTNTCRAGTLQKIRYAPPRSQSTTAAGEVAPSRQRPGRIRRARSRSGSAGRRSTKAGS